METESLTWNTEGKKWQTSQNIKRENRKCKENQETSKCFNISWEVQNDIVFKKQDQNIVKSELFKYKNELLDIKNIWELNDYQWASQIELVVMNQPANTGDIRDVVQSLAWEEPLEKEMATHSSILAWKIPWTEESDGLQSMGLQRVGHDWNDWAQHNESKES